MHSNSAIWQAETHRLFHRSGCRHVLPPLPQGEGGWYSADRQIRNIVASQASFNLNVNP